jgi:hypothetical protein
MSKLLAFWHEAKFHHWCIGIGIVELFAATPIGLIFGWETGALSLANAAMLYGVASMLAPDKTESEDEANG